MYQTEKKKHECLLDGVAMELQSAPYVLMNQNHVLFALWSDDHETTSKTQRSNEMQSNWSQYECNVC